MQITRPTWTHTFAALAALVFAHDAHAAAGFVGTWATDLAQCKIGQDRQEAPLVLSERGYDQHESHCTFKSVEGGDGEWKVKSDCTIEGNAEPYDFTLTVSGDTLTVTDESGSRDLLKCP